MTYSKNSTFTVTAGFAYFLMGTIISAVVLYYAGIQRVAIVEAKHDSLEKTVNNINDNVQRLYDLEFKR